MTEEQTTPTNLDLPYIKLTKNRNGYTWDIKMMGLDVQALKKKNEELLKEFDVSIIVGSAKDGNFND